MDTSESKAQVIVKSDEIIIKLHDDYEIRKIIRLSNNRIQLLIDTKKEGTGN